MIDGGVVTVTEAVERAREANARAGTAKGSLDEALRAIEILREEYRVLQTHARDAARDLEHAIRRVVGDTP
jgi:hypothetical protein